MQLCKKVQDTQNYKICYNNYDPLVSSDFQKCEYTSIIDHRFTQIKGGNMLKLTLWYDNEWGYATKVVDIIDYVREKEKMKIIASNFKTNHTRSTTKDFVESINDFLQLNKIENQVFIFPPATAIDSFDTVENLNVGVQNAHYVKNGSFTGEIGTEQLDEFGIKTILIGHSERRHIMKETQKEITLKYNYYKALGYKIIYCVGEPLEVREKGLSDTLGYIMEQFNGIDLGYENLVVAYEPVWAIGTGVVATVEEIAQVHKKLKKKFTQPLLYGGSVKPSNLEEILSIENVDGTLIGTASWDVDAFKQMIKISSEK